MVKKFKITAKNASFIAVMTALMAVFMLIAPISPMVAYVGSAIVPLIIIAVSASAEGLFAGVVMGAVFGIISFAGSFFVPSLMAECFHNPLISVLPRVFIGAVVYYAGLWLDKAVKSKSKKAGFVKNGLAAAAGAAFNTAAVMGLVALFFGGKTVGSGGETALVNAKLILGIVAANGGMEFLGAFILTPPIVSAVKKINGASALKKSRENRGIEPPPPDAIRAQKAALRAAIKQKAADFAASGAKPAADGQIFDGFFEYEDVKTARNIMIYKSFDNEPDTGAIIAELFERGKNVYLPVLRGGGIIAVPVGKDSVYVKNQYAIDEPVFDENDAQAEAQARYRAAFDIVVVPLVAFDGGMNRLGRGKGCYDAFLKLLPPDTKKIALAYSFQRVAKIPTEKFDVRIDGVIVAA
ncbi:MAG: 5-formyltetrahydrofolate cyclo-ligase [Clostridiales bacterium]|jgi:5,10-methenyltetrahydrofolate synthetase|nr:5-formyltetrahydrofolate cyclo-ligase [Clostridiales bacterium]